MKKILIINTKRSQKRKARIRKSTVVDQEKKLKKGMKKSPINGEVRSVKAKKY